MTMVQQVGIGIIIAGILFGGQFVLIQLFRKLDAIHRTLKSIDEHIRKQK